MSDTIKAVTEAVRGRVITPSDPDYDDPRAVYFMSSDDDHSAPANHGANYERLAAVTATYDPDDVFHINQNIVPANGR